MSESDTDGLLTQANIRDLLNQLWTAAAVWYQLGLQLGISTATLEVIMRDHPTTRERFTKMLEEWVKGRATKRILIEALRSEAIQENRLADNVEKWAIPSIPLPGMLHYTTSKIQPCHCSFKKTVCLLFALVLVLVLVIMLFHRQTPYTMNVQSPSKKTLLPLLPATAPLTTQTNNNGDDLDACLPDLSTLNPLDLSLLATEPLIGREKETKTILKWLEFRDSLVQVVSIVGGPGVGKSALAVAVGHKLIQQGITVCYVDMYNVSGRIQISKYLQESAKQVRHPTLLILDNSDHYIHTQKMEFQNLVLSHKYHFVKILITSQISIPVTFSGNNFEEYHLQKLDKEQAKILLQQNIKGLTSSIAGYICDLVDSMPLAIINIAARLNLKSTCNLQCILTKLERDPIDFFTETEMQGKYSVIASIKLAYNYISLDPNFQKCGWELVTVSRIKYARENVCLDELKKYSIIEVVKLMHDTRMLYADACVSYPLHLDLDQCYTLAGVASRHVYGLPRLIRKYFLKATSKNVTSKLSSVASEAVEVVREKMELLDYVRFRMCTPLLERSGELHSWSSETIILMETLPLLISTYVDYIPLKVVVEIGTKAFYWGTPSDFFETDTVKKFAVSSLEWLDGAIASHDKDQAPEVMLGSEHVLAAYVYFNHKSLGIQWPTRTQCPSPTEAVSTMLKRKHQVEVLHHMTGQNDLAWSAYRAFYIDLFSCCMAAPQFAPGCEQLWEYWLKGIVAQAVATNFLFQHVSPCEGSPAVVISSTFRGLWYYYNNKYSDAKYHLIQELLEQENQKKCLILRIATIMALYSMSEEVSERAKVTNHLSNKLMDFGLPQYQEIYHRVIIPFYRQVNKSEEAERLEELLNIKSSHYLNVPYKCEYIYWVHNTSYETYVLPPYVDHKGVNPLSTLPILFLILKVIFSSFVIIVMLEYTIWPCTRKKVTFVRHQKFLKFFCFGIIYTIIQTVGLYFDIYITFIPNNYTVYGVLMASYFFCYYMFVILFTAIWRKEFYITCTRCKCLVIITCTRLGALSIILCCSIIAFVVIYYFAVQVSLLYIPIDQTLLSEVSV